LEEEKQENIKEENLNQKKSVETKTRTRPEIENKNNIYFVKVYKKRLLLALGILVAIVMLIFRIELATQENHNLAKGLPIDFNSEIYLDLNPGLEEFWNSKGIKHNNRQELLNHAEIHFLGFGNKDGWIYKGNFQKIFYNKYLPIDLIPRQIFVIPVILLAILLAFDFVNAQAIDKFKKFKKHNIIRISIILALAIFCGTVIYMLPYITKSVHNKTVGLPFDFDPETYLEINPGLEQFWTSKGIKHKSKKALLEHAETHYRDFGAKDNWKYK
jgi:uncharacterized membrane protein